MLQANENAVVAVKLSDNSRNHRGILNAVKCMGYGHDKTIYYKTIAVRTTLNAVQYRLLKSQLGFEHFVIMTIAISL